MGKRKGNIIRFRSSYSQKLELQFRQNDMSGTTYEHICYFVDRGEHPEAYFLYPSEEKEYG